MTPHFLYSLLILFPNNKNDRYLLKLIALDTTTTTYVITTAISHIIRNNQKGFIISSGIW